MNHESHTGVSNGNVQQQISGSTGLERVGRQDLDDDQHCIRNDRTRALALNISSDTTTTETDSISASVSTTGLAAGSYSTVINVSASGSSNSPQAIPVTLTVAMPSSTGTATLSWDDNSETNVVGYSLHGHTVRWHGTPIAVANATTYLIDNLTGGRTYYFSVTAVDNEGTESLHITEVSKTVF